MNWLVHQHTQISDAGLCVACRQVPDAPEGATGKKTKASKGNKKEKKEKEDKGKSKEKGKKDEEEGAAAPVILAAGKHFSLDLGREDDRAVACLLADHELQASATPLCLSFSVLVYLSLSVSGCPSVSCGAECLAVVCLLADHELQASAAPLWLSNELLMRVACQVHRLSVCASVCRSVCPSVCLSVLQ